MGNKKRTRVKKHKPHFSKEVKKRGGETKKKKLGF